MLNHRLTNGAIAGRKQQTAVKQTVERPTKTKSWYPNHSYPRHQPYSSPIPSQQIIHDLDDWLKPLTTVFDDTPELDMSCQDETLSAAQLEHYPTQVSPLIPGRSGLMVHVSLFRHTIRRHHFHYQRFVSARQWWRSPPQKILRFFKIPTKILFQVNQMMTTRTTMKTICPNTIDVPTRVATASTVMSVEMWLFTVESPWSILGRGRGGRGHLAATSTRLPPSTHFVRPQPLVKSHSRSQLYSTSISSMHRHRSTDSLAMELERTYAAALPRYYGTRQGQTTTATDYGDFRISMGGQSCPRKLLSLLV